MDRFFFFTLTLSLSFFFFFFSFSKQMETIAIFVLETIKTISKYFKSPFKQTKRKSSEKKKTKKPTHWFPKFLFSVCVLPYLFCYDFLPLPSSAKFRSVFFSLFSIFPKILFNSFRFKILFTVSKFLLSIYSFWNICYLVWLILLLFFLLLLLLLILPGNNISLCSLLNLSGVMC